MGLTAAARGWLLMGVIAGYLCSFDNIVMRVMDGLTSILMSISTFLLAIALI
ncbi:hypothetical protein [Mesorhizobium sp.]|uniref:hypothetical protein n=1 Tax=Mesorhizobium sp. TaxID=1871066 RepID=UPI0025C1980B|nr:hypothetical protein [Mesorhizobium sp.]